MTPEKRLWVARILNGPMVYADLIHRLIVWTSAFIEIVEGIITVITFAIFRPSWSFRFTVWAALHEIEKKQIKIVEVE